ncbi:zf-HC2 domain-containing protein [Nocardia paucivorans]|uniref:zf-HC2 domain-containing protein n=1 Tax=Nocardia paucivorans TaxID=114259 RepID=UPI0003024D6D|nr:zf-HC2 domain-containing protein [Nocardia paucivorans]
MECSVARECLSARLDGEAESVPAARLDEHLRRCPDCRRWHVAAAESTQRFRLAVAAPVPDLDERVLAAVLTPARQWFPDHRNR